MGSNFRIRVKKNVVLTRLRDVIQLRHPLDPKTGSGVSFPFRVCKIKNHPFTFTVDHWNLTRKKRAASEMATLLKPKGPSTAGVFVCRGVHWF